MRGPPRGPGGAHRQPSHSPSRSGPPPHLSQADTILKTYNGQSIPGTDQVFRLNWAAYGVGKAAPAGEGRFARAARGRLLARHRQARMAPLQDPLGCAPSRAPAPAPQTTRCLWATWRRT